VVISRSDYTQTATAAPAQLVQPDRTAAQQVVPPPLVNRPALDRSGAQMAKAVSAKIALPAKGLLVAPQVANFPVTIGTLRAGDSVQITIAVSVNTPRSATSNVSNDGTSSGSDCA